MLPEKTNPKTKEHIKQLELQTEKDRIRESEITNLFQIMERLKRLRNGEKVACRSCETGIMLPIGNYKTTYCFKCNVCGARINID